VKKIRQKKDVKVYFGIDGDLHLSFIGEKNMSSE